MKFTRPWTTVIGEHQFGAELNVDELLDEAMNHPDIMANPKVGSVRINKRDFPKCYAAIDQHLRAQVKEYMAELGLRMPKLLKWSSWFHLCLHGQGLEPHYHMGDEHLATVLYLTEAKAGIVLRDPRANFVRHFPQDMQAVQHADQLITPGKGKFVIFPTFVDHWVMAMEPEFRVCIAVDWCFK